MNFTMKVEGLEALEKELTTGLPAATQKRVMRSALMYALTPIQKAAKAKVPKDTGELAKSIKKKSLITRANNFFAEAGIHMATNKKQTGWKWHFIEFGTSSHKIKIHPRRGKKLLSNDGTGYGKEALIPAIAAQPFLRPAFAEKSREALARFKKQMAKRILKETK